MYIRDEATHPSDRNASGTTRLFPLLKRLKGGGAFDM